MILSLRRQATVAVAALVAGASPLLSGVAVEASGSLSGAGTAPVRVFPAGSVGRVEVGSVPHGPDVAGPRSARAPQEAAPGSYPPPPDRLGGATAPRVGRADPVRPAGQVSLLALVATICVVGVSAGAIRAIFAQRTTQTVIA
ncbi:hypothetical protein C6361_17845 [Plantactinospora sp. BC1]|uniref:hypothetical protein n=1 Tax=Plantactinospora sp. BC1 TaxID=2108470 RepID=UPI000D152CA4|nr:hypothetical protein [Plantactinospora sp. BC1]AVT31026.1 hypothetical protein C6361_17845 [Plantactinospora sp. BC1]